MPCAASTSRIAPSQAASERETSYVKSTWPGVSIMFRRTCRRSSPRHAHGLRLDRDAALALDVHAVEVLRAHVAVETTPVICSMRSASVDLPWSMWAMMQKLRISSEGSRTAREASGRGVTCPEQSTGVCGGAPAPLRDQRPLARRARAAPDEKELTAILLPPRSAPRKLDLTFDGTGCRAAFTSVKPFRLTATSSSALNHRRGPPCMRLSAVACEIRENTCPDPTPDAMRPTAEAEATLVVAAITAGALALTGAVAPLFPLGRRSPRTPPCSSTRCTAGAATARPPTRTTSSSS
jgi:hypothetical protein